MVINDVTVNAELIDIIGELKRQLQINSVPLLKSVKDTPDNIMVSCPYHKDGQENRPSAGISKSTGVFHCFACGEVHSLPEVISYCFGRTDDIVGSFGWQWILKNFLTVQVENRKSIELDMNRTVQEESTTYIPDEVLETYRYYHNYMWKRKMTPEIVEKFDIGYDKDTQCITFPVRDINGNCIFVARRSVNTKFFNYPSGVKKPVYGLYELYSLPTFPKEVIICESMIDAITCWVYGKYAVALNGLGNDLQFEQLNKMPCRKFILATDNDDAGKQARIRLRKNIRCKIITEYILPSNRKDINDLSEEEFNKLVEQF